MTARGDKAKSISNEFVRKIKEGDDLQRQESERGTTAERPPTRTVAALHPSEPSFELASIE